VPRLYPAAISYLRGLRSGTTQSTDQKCAQGTGQPPVVWLTHRCHSSAVHAAGCSAAVRQVHCCSSSAWNASLAQPVVQQLHCSGSSAYDAS
jgi:hypothetical protein